MRILQLMLILGLSAFFACDKDDNDPECTIQIAPGTRFFEFKSTADGKTFTAWTADTAVISQVRAQLQLPEAERFMHINGEIERLPAGCRELNKPWSWYFPADKWALAEISIEVCDGTPTYVEENIGEFVDNVGRYCPWSSFVLREVQSPL